MMLLVLDLVASSIHYRLRAVHYVERASERLSTSAGWLACWFVGLVC